MRSAAAAAGVLVAATAGVAWLLAGPWGVGYLGLYACATLPGWPLGWALFGRRHAAGWIAGGVLGYALTAMALGVAIQLGQHSAMALVAAWALTTTVTWGATARRDEPLVKAPAWTSRDTVALAVTLLLVPTLIGPPFAHVGARDRQGNRYYRAYFTADFLWHVALTTELSRFTLPPSNPYLADHTLHYYWTYFMVPAAVAETLDRGGASVERALKVNALGAGLLFLGTVFLSMWLVVPRARAVSLALALAVLSSSAEGTYAVWDLAMRGRTLEQILDGLRDLNVDAVTNWVWGGLRVDGLQRSLWYVPQHAAACALGLVGLMVATAGGVSAPVGAVLLAGLAFALSVTFSPLIGGAFALAYGLSVVVALMLERPVTLKPVLRHAVAAMPVVAGLAWCAGNQMFEGAGSALQLGWAGPASRAPVRTLLLGLGPLVAAAAAGLWPLRDLPRQALPAALSACVGLGLMYFVMLVPDPYWVGFRAGQVLLVTLPVFAACFFQRLFRPGRLRWVAMTAAIGLFAVGLPTSLVDTITAQDIANQSMGPGFHWTIHVTPLQQQAFSWIRRTTWRDAIVQMDPSSRGRESWTLIPSFAQRRMVAGLPISLLHSSIYDNRSSQVHDLYNTASAEAAWQAARSLGIDYLYLDNIEKVAFAGAGVDKFEHNPQFFHAVFRNAEVVVYAVTKPVGPSEGSPPQTHR